MEIRQLRYFLAVCKYGNITKAAESLYITQQTLSKQIKNFEAELEVPLFIRSAGGVAPTEYAKNLMEPARQITRTADQALRTLDEMRKQETVTVRLGLIRGDFNDYSPLSPRILFEWERAFPQMTLEIREYSPDELEQVLLQGDLDLAYTNGDETPGLQKILFSLEPAYVLASQQNALFQTKNITLEELRQQPVLIPSVGAMPEENRRLLGVYLGSEPRFRVYNGIFEQGVEHVRANEGVLFAARSYCLSRNLDGLVTFPFPNPEYVFYRYLAYRKDRRMPAPVQYFIKEHHQRPL